MALGPTQQNTGNSYTAAADRSPDQQEDLRDLEREVEELILALRQTNTRSQIVDTLEDRIDEKGSSTGSQGGNVGLPIDALGDSVDLAEDYRGSHTATVDMIAKRLREEVEAAQFNAAAESDFSFPTSDLEVIDFPAQGTNNRAALQKDFLQASRANGIPVGALHPAHPDNPYTKSYSETLDTIDRELEATQPGQKPQAQTTTNIQDGYASSFQDSVDAALEVQSNTLAA